MSADVSLKQIARSAVQLVRAGWDRIPLAAMVLGTGASQLVQSIDVDLAIDYAEIPGFVPSTALGHRGRLVCGTLSGRPVAALQGRHHLYEGYSLQQVLLPIALLRMLGARLLLISNAAGGLNPAMRCGDLMLIDSHIDMMFRCASADGETGAPRIVQRADAAYDQSLMQQLQTAAQKDGLALQRGVYVGMLGPSYETRAECRFLRQIGGDAVGMSTIPEVNAAHRLGARAIAVSVIANLALADRPAPISGQQVVDAARNAEAKLSQLFRLAVELAGNGPD